MTRPTCATCWHFDQSPEAIPPYGLCRVRPPTADAFKAAVWPWVNAAHDYCAEHFEPAEEPAP